MIKLSKASKMPCKSWSLEALTTCPGSRKPGGELVDACAGCYATTGNYRFPNVKAPRLHNQSDWLRDEWCDDMIAAIGTESYFRWFDSGDMYDIRLAEKILQVMKATPNTRHWLPTRMHKFAKFRPMLAKMSRLANVVVRRSSDSIKGETVRGKNSSTIIAFPDQAKPDQTVCRAYEREGKCGECRACWDKNTPVIAYPAHGVKMTKLIEVKSL